MHLHHKIRQILDKRMGEFSVCSALSSSQMKPALQPLEFTAMEPASLPANVHPKADHPKETVPQDLGSVVCSLPRPLAAQ